MYKWIFKDLDMQSMVCIDIYKYMYVYVYLLKYFSYFPFIVNNGGQFT